MINDTELEQVIEQLDTAEVDFSQLKNEVKKLPTIEKMAKAADMKKLQQVTRLHTQHKRIDNVTDL